MNLERIPWIGLQFIRNDWEYPSISKLRQFPKEFLLANYPYRISIVWKCQQGVECGFPSEAEMNMQVEFENELVEEVETNQQSVLALTIMGQGEKEFIFHSSNHQGLLNALQRIKEKRNLPLEYHTSKDLEWNETRNRIFEFSSGRYDIYQRAWWKFW